MREGGREGGTRRDGGGGRQDREKHAEAKDKKLGEKRAKNIEKNLIQS